MKYVVLVGDGMGDYPVPEFNNQTILQAAHIPNMRRMAAAGVVKMINTVPAGLPPGSDVANLGLLGYHAAENYTGRAPIEAAGAGIPMSPSDVAYRCNLVNVQDGKMIDYSAGHISTEEGRAIAATLDEKLGRPGRRFHGGVQYRHLLIWENGPVKIKTEPPHEISDRAIAPYLPTGERDHEVRELIEASKPILASHPVNAKRAAAGKRTASQIWLWGQGRALTLLPYQKKFGLSGGIITAVDLVRGLGVLAGLETPNVPGATGFLDTNYANKVSYALDILKRHDFVYVHVEAPDECGHLGDAKKKKQAIEDFDAKVVGPIWQALQASGEKYRVMVTMDHRTPVSLKGHSREPVPMAVVDGPVKSMSAEAPFDESVNGGKAGANSWEWINELLGASGR